jgi:hypothetical protein
MDDGRFMKKDFLFNRHNFEHFFYSNSNDIARFNPISFTNYFKGYFQKEYLLYSDAIREATQKQIPLMHIRNMHQISYDISTPYCGVVQDQSIMDLICHMYGTIGLMNTFPVLYKDETKDIIRAVAPRANSQFEHSSQSPYTDLDWHVDAAYRPMMASEHLSPMPDYLVFGVVHKGHEDLPLVYATLDDILSELEEEDLQVGLSPEFSVSSPDSFSNKMVSQNVPLLHQDSAGQFSSRIALRGSQGLTDRASYFLKKISEILGQKSIEKVVHVEPGDIVILNNKNTVHKRNSFTPQWDGKDRYFIRMYSVNDIGQGIFPDPLKQWEWY